MHEVKKIFCLEFIWSYRGEDKYITFMSKKLCTHFRRLWLRLYEDFRNSFVIFALEAKSGLWSAADFEEIRFISKGAKSKERSSSEHDKNNSGDIWIFVLRTNGLIQVYSKFEANRSSGSAKILQQKSQNNWENLHRRDAFCWPQRKRQESIFYASCKSSRNEFYAMSRPNWRRNSNNLYLLRMRNHRFRAFKLMIWFE